MSKKKNKKGKQRQAANRAKKRKQATRKPHRAGPSSSGGLLKKSGDLYHVRSQAGLNVLLGSGKPTLVDFWAPWCQPCLRMGPIFERIASKYGEQINFAKVDTQSLPKVGKRYGVQSIPTIIAFDGRQEARREVGLMNEPAMKRFAESFLPEEEEEYEEEEQNEEQEQDAVDESGQESGKYTPHQEQPGDKGGDDQIASERKSSGGFGKRLKKLFGGGKK